MSNLHKWRVRFTSPHKRHFDTSLRQRVISSKKLHSLKKSLHQNSFTMPKKRHYTKRASLRQKRSIKEKFKNRSWNFFWRRSTFWRSNVFWLSDALAKGRFWAKWRFLPSCAFLPREASLEAQRDLFLWQSYVSKRRLCAEVTPTPKWTIRDKFCNNLYLLLYLLT